MDTAPQSGGTAAASGFFAALHALAQHKKFEIQFEREDATLHVEISALGLNPLVASGTPAALDAQLPAAVARYARWVDTKTQRAESITIDSPADVDDKPARAPRPAAKKKAPPKKRPAPKPAPKPRPAKPAPKRRAAPAPTPSAEESRAGKPECLADYRALKAKHGAKLTRRLFVDTAPTGRRYEKLWGNSWPAFVKEAEAGKPAASAPPPAAASAPAKKSAPPKPAAKPKAEPKTDTKPGAWTVKGADGRDLGVTVLEKKPGDKYTCSAGAFTVESIDAAKRAIVVRPWKPGDGATVAAPPATPKTTINPGEPWPFPGEPGALIAGAPYAIVDADGKKHGATVAQLEVGATFGTGDKWEITAIDHVKREYTVRDRAAPPPAAAQSTEEPA